MTYVFPEAVLIHGTKCASIAGMR